MNKRRFPCSAGYFRMTDFPMRMLLPAIDGLISPPILEESNGVTRIRRGDDTYRNTPLAADGGKFVIANSDHISPKTV